MAFTAMKLQDVPVTGAIRLVAGTTDVGLFMAKTDVVTEASDEFATTLTPLPLGGQTSKLPRVTIPQLFATPPDFDLAVAADGTLGVAYQTFGGASNAVHVGGAGPDGLKTLFAYAAADCRLPRFVRDVSGSGRAVTLATVTRDDQDVALIVPGAPDSSGQIATTSVPLAAAGSGVAFGNFGAGPPSTLGVVFKVDRRMGPLAPGELFVGKLALAAFDLSAQTLTTPMPLLPDAEFAEFDIAYQAGVYCLLATTGDGLPLLAAFDAAGKLLGGAYLPYGSWTSRRGWVTNPTIVVDPQQNGVLKFDYAFVEMSDDAPTGIVCNSIGVSTTGGVTPDPRGG